ncbi:ankyrin repeat-containing domain protein [Roridomyces roridus]|uniref:Ankyrin repeat-containing domain protein n=1 Tax=Roridomyces roridus TaxID=1738132 RepID=A0AAD7BUI7_9AGAR|nr:ankyrin repeat-containing domain protein [Roridomyces roridus]
MSSFDNAVAYLSNSTPSDVPSTVKLELYGLFKFVTVSSLPTSPRPSIFDFTGRAKWDAWAAAGNKYTDKSAAQARYLEIAQSLGWTEGKAVESTSENKSNGGFGVSVSAMERPKDEDDGTLQGLAVSNDLEGLTVLLQKNPDLNATDEYGYTALHLASDRGHLAIVELLLKNGADRTIKDEDGLSALELAEAAGHQSVVKLLNT